MPCYHPLKAFDITKLEGTTKNNKKKNKITSYLVNHLELKNNRLEMCHDSFVSPYAEMVFRDWTEISCGQCIGCRLEYSRQWANRMLCESLSHSENYFITLTYNDRHLPISYYGNASTGEVEESFTLVKRDVQLFLKRLRKNTGQQFRYYLCGEYGSETHRPHYHLIVFGLHLDDLVEKFRRDGNYFYNSETIEKAWSVNGDPIGFAILSDVTWNTCAYTARYVTKKLTGAQSEFYDTFNIVPEFSLMSRRPGIARAYYDENRDIIFKYDEIYLKNGDVVRPMKYFERIYSEQFPELAEIRSERRQERALEQRELLLSQTKLDFLEVLQLQEDAQRNRKKVLDSFRSL